MRSPRAAMSKLFREQNDGAYMFFTSTSGLLGNIGQANYGAAKMGIAGLSRIIAMEGARNNVRSNCVAPVAWTRMTQSVPVKDEAAAARRAVMAEKIRAAIGVVDWRVLCEPKVTLSIGFTALRPMDAPAAAFERADKAVYYAKHHGRNQVFAFESLVARG